MTSIAAALVAARGKLPAAEARLLLGHALQRDAAWLLAHDSTLLDENALLAFASLVARRHGGEPVAYLLGRREFYGRDFAVGPGVLIPRPETELLVDLVKEKVGAGGTATLLDLGTGSGCIAITLALECPLCTVTAVECSPIALVIARRNSGRLNAAVEFISGDWFAPLAGRRFDFIVGNPPYVAEGDLHLAQGDLRSEPHEALVSGIDGLDALRAIVIAAPNFLRPGGGLWLEHGFDQAEAAAELLANCGFIDTECRRDLAGLPRISGGIIRE